MATVHYQHHPFHGEEVEVVRRSRRSPTESVVVRAWREGTQLVVPCWMLDADVCGRLPEERTPRVSVEALTTLRRLLDSQPILASARSHEQEKGRIPKERR